MTELRNVGSRATLVARRTQADPARLLADLRLNDGPILTGRLAADFTVVDVLRPHADVYTTLQRGTYYVVSLNPAGLTTGDVAATRVDGSKQETPVPVAFTEFVMTSANRLTVPSGTEDVSAIYAVDHSANAVQLRMYRLSSSASAKHVAAFVAKPSWSALRRLPVASKFDLAALASTRQVSDSSQPAYGRYVVIAVPLVERAVNRPQLRRGLAVSVRLHG